MRIRIQSAASTLVSPQLLYGTLEEEVKTYVRATRSPVWTSAAVSATTVGVLGLAATIVLKMLMMSFMRRSVGAS